jgi:hypothetical protein
MARKGTTVTEAQVRWNEVSDEAWSAARAAASARAANGNPMTEAEIEFRARNAQDRADLRSFVFGGNLSANCKSMTRAELVEEINRQLVTGIHGNSRQAFKKVVEAREDAQARRDERERAYRTISAKFSGHCVTCGRHHSTGDQVRWSPGLHTVTCMTCGA